MSAACEKRAVGLPVRHHQVKGIKMSVVFALLAMICKSAVDLLSNRSMKNNQGRSVHFFYLLQSGAMFLIMAVLTGIGVFRIQGSWQVILYSILIGIGSFLSYLFYLYSLRGESSTAYITIYRLNFIVTSAIGILVLGEKLTAGKLIGTAFFIVALILFLDLRSLKKSKLDKFMLFSILSCLIIGVVNIVNKVALDADIPSDTLLFFRYLFVTGLTLLYFPLAKVDYRSERSQAGGRTILFAIVSGSLLLGSLFLFYRAMKIGEVSVVTPIVQSCFIVSSLVNIVVFKEKLSARKLAGLLLAILCILIISL